MKRAGRKAGYTERRGQSKRSGFRIRIDRKLV